MTQTLNHFSIDCETLGVRWNAPVIAIGCQQFDPDTGKLGAVFYKEIKLQSAIASGRVDGETLAWWMKQSADARNVFAADSSKLDLATVLAEFSTWMRGLSAAPIVWGNCATADITWLEHAYDCGSVGLREAWHFTNIRDMRTLLDVAQFDKSKVPFAGTAHNAKDDATWQAKVISAAWQKVRGASVVINKASKAEQAAATVDDDDEL